MTADIFNTAALVTLIAFMLCVPIGAFMAFEAGIALMITGAVGLVSSLVLGSE